MSPWSSIQTPVRDSAPTTSIIQASEHSEGGKEGTEHPHPQKKCCRSRLCISGRRFVAFSPPSSSKRLDYVVFLSFLMFAAVAALLFFFFSFLFVSRSFVYPIMFVSEARFMNLEERCSRENWRMGGKRRRASCHRRKLFAAATAAVVHICSATV